MNVTSTLCCIPQEVLEHIAFHLGTEPFLGPPSSIPALLLSCLQLNSQLSFNANHHLYARIFCSKFDTAAAQSRLGIGRLTSKPLAEELKKRCRFLKGLKARLDSTVGARHQREGVAEMSVRDTLFTAYVMVLENEGKNVAQLEEFGEIRTWIREFWFDVRGSSLAIYNIQTGNWPFMCAETALGMWLLWFFLCPEDYTSADDSPESPLNLIKAIAVGAHVFNLTTLGWAESDSDDDLYTITLYGEKIACRAPPLAVPAILSYFTLSLPAGRLVPQTPRFASLPHPSWKEWELEWSRSFPRVDHLAEHFRAGSMEGAWEGFFIYPEFEAYASLLAGAPPSVAQKCLVGRHQQTWKLREYHLIAADGHGSSFDINPNSEGEADMPPAGSPLRAYFPPGANVHEIKEGLIMTCAGSSKALKYTRYSKSRHYQTSHIRDIIIVGEGHSAWGQFNILGRVRPYDGFVTLLKDYANGARGQWLYRAYLVGNSNGNLAGRWRDTWTPLDHQGYEGCFIMSRRR